MLSIKFVGFLFHGVNNFFHDLQALLFISVGFSFPVCYKGLKFTLKTFNKCDMPNNVMHKQDESPAADSSASQNQHAYGKPNVAIFYSFFLYVFLYYVFNYAFKI